MLDNAYGLDESHDFTAEMFDAVFVYASSPEEVKAIMRTINPVTSVKCCYKPFIALKSVKGRMGEYDELIDHYTYDIDDIDSLDTVDEIIKATQDAGVVTDHNRTHSANIFFIRLCRYLISRGRTRLEPVLQENSSMGYVIPIFELFFEQQAFTLSEYITFYQSMLERGFIKVLRFINKIYLCPKCLRSHLLYIECCPRCHHSLIKSEDVIHHFRCANISPEHTYNFGGQLRCPKCHQLLRHIGVDYDRPSVVYTCQHCDNMFLQPQMTVVCTSCHTTTDVSDLTPHDITAFELTPLGREHIVSPNIGFTIYTDFFDNYIDYDRFVSRLRLLAELNEVNAGVQTVMDVAKIWLLDDNETTCQPSDELIAHFCRQFPTHKVSSAGNMIYVKGIVNNRDGEDAEYSQQFRDAIENAMQQATATLHDGERICYTLASPNEGIDAFLASLSFVEPYPDKQFVSTVDVGVTNYDGSPDGDYDVETDDVESTSNIETSKSANGGHTKTQNSSFQHQDDNDAISPQAKWYIIMLLIILSVLFVALGFYIKAQNYSSVSTANYELRVKNLELSAYGGL